MKPEIYPETISAIGTSKAGISLKEIYRWSQFRTDETNETWLDVLGATGQVFSHQKLFAKIGEKFIASENGRFTPEEQETFLMALRIHDIGEAVIDGWDSVGDVGAFAKTNLDERKETKIAKKVIASLNLDNTAKNQLLNAYDQVIVGKNSNLNFAFKALEKTEYVMTAMQVFLSGQALRMAGENGIVNEIPLIARVLVLDLPNVLEVYAPVFPESIGSFFKENSKTIDAMFAYSLPWLDTTTEWRGKAADHKTKAEEFKVKWKDFKNSPPHTVNL